MGKPSKKPSVWASKYVGRHAWKARALDLLEETRSPKHVCRALGMHRSTLCDARAADREFAKDWKEVKRGIVEDLQVSALTRAIEGTESVVLHQGRPVRIKGKILTERKYETALTIFLLKVLGGTKYRFEHESLSTNEAAKTALAIREALSAIENTVPTEP